jgi:hypothetical protein
MRVKSCEETGPPGGKLLQGEPLMRATDLPQKIPVGYLLNLDPGLLTTDPGYIYM